MNHDLGRRWLAAGGGWRERMAGWVDWDESDDWGWLQGDGQEAVQYIGWQPWWNGRVFIGREMSRTGGICKEFVITIPDGLPIPANIYPDFSDGPTRGAALDVVRERWGDPLIYFTAAADEECPEEQTWTIWRQLLHGSRVIASGESEGGALVAALEAHNGP